MKTTILIALALLSVCAVRAQKQTDAELIQEYVHQGPDGSFVHSRFTATSIVEITESRIVIECGQMCDWVYDAKTMQVVPHLRETDTSKWREIYEIKDGKLVLVAIQRPKLGPSVVSQLTWGQDNLAVKD